MARLEKIERILSDFLPENASGKWISESFGKIDECVSGEHIKPLTAPTRRLVSLGGKRWRPLLLVLCAQMAAESRGLSEGETQERIDLAYKIAPLVEGVHTASLIHDDIEDGADTRRGQAAAHVEFGEDVALNAGSWLYFHSATSIQKLSLDEKTKLALYELFLEELRRLHLGQAMDILWHRNPEIVPKIEEYRAMVRNKTGTLARLAVRAGMMGGGADVEAQERAGKIAEDIGTGFQIIDDVVNLTTGNPGKKRGDDIVEGKKSLPVILHLQKNPGDVRILSGLFESARTEGIESESVEKAIQMLTQSGSVEEARKIGNQLIEEKSEALAGIFGKKGEGSKLILELFGTLKK